MMRLDMRSILAQRCSFILRISLLFKLLSVLDNVFASTDLCLIVGRFHLARLHKFP